MSTLSKSIMIDLEKRLERKERCQGIECYLVGVIFLNCVERMSWCLKAHENTKETPEVGSYGLHHYLGAYSSISHH